MRKGKAESSDELRNEYDFNELGVGVRGRYLRRYRAGSNLALLEPDVAAAFPTDEAVNEALRAILKAAAAIRRGRRPIHRTLQSSSGAGKVTDRTTKPKRTTRRPEGHA